MPIRIQKFLASQGIASRRKIERWIKTGEVCVDGKTCTLGQQVNGDERITIRGQHIHLHTEIKNRVLIYHKPVGEVVSRADPQQRPTVFDRLPALQAGRWIAVGRLDVNTSGLLLFTTDGTLANGLMHPCNQIEREYRVRVYGSVTDEALSRLQRGVQLDDGPAKLEILEALESSGMNTWYRIVLREGRNREVRKLWKSQGLEVNRLVRTRFGVVTLPKALRQGEWVDLSARQIRQLYALTGASGKQRSYGGKWAGKIYERLLQQHGHQHWWPASSEFEVMVGAILTQNTAWKNVERAIANLKTAGCLDANKIINATPTRLATLIKPSGYFNVKAKRLQKFCEWYVASGGMARLRYWPTATLRKQLLDVHGIGNETADDILLYAFHRPVFVIDAYTRRIFSRLGHVQGNEPYDELRRAFEIQLANHPKLLGEYHALVVQHGKDICKVKPECGRCELGSICKFNNETVSCGNRD